MSGRWKTILFGVGRMGRNHLRVLLESPHFELVGVVDPEINGLGLDLPTNIRTWSNPHDVFENSSIDFQVAVVATPTDNHFDIARPLIEAGKNVLVEKPLAASVEESHELIALARKHKTLLKVGHLERLNPAVRRLKEVIDSGWVGTPIHFSFTRVGGYPAHASKRANVLMDLAVHDIDVLHFLVGTQPAFEVRGAAIHSTWQPGVLDTAEVLLESPRSMSASVHVNWVTPTKIRNVRVTGTRGVCMVDYILQTCTLYGGNLLKNRGEPQAGFEELQRLYQNTDKIEFGVDREEPLKIQLREFHNALSGKPSLICDATEAAEAVRIAEASLKSKAPSSSRRIKRAA